MSEGKLWLPGNFTETTIAHKKAKPPPLGEKFLPQWGNDHLAGMRLPGGGLLQFDLSRLTLSDYRSMRDHYQIAICLYMLTFMLHQVEYELDCTEKRIKTAAEEAFIPMWTRFVRALSQAYWAGYSPVVIQWENDPITSRTLFTKFKDVIPEDADINYRTELGWAPPGQAKPKMRIYDGIKVRGGGYPVPVDATLWYPLLMENGDMRGRKLLRTAFPPWFFSQLIHLYSNRYFERFGEPVPIGRAPFDEPIEVDGRTINGRDAMINIIENVRNRGAVVLPNDERTGSATAQQPHYEYTLEYLESQMRGADFERYLTRLDEEMSLALFTPLLMVRTADVGSYNLGVTHVQSWMMMFNALAGDVKEYADRYLLNRFVDFNFSRNAPRVTIRFKQYGKHDTELIRSVITSVLSGGAAKVDLKDLGEAAGLSLSEVRTITAPDGTDGDDPGPGGPKPRDADPAEPKGPAKVSRSRAAVRNGKTYGTFVDAVVADGFSLDRAEMAYDIATGWLAETHLTNSKAIDDQLTRMLGDLLG